MGNPWTAKVLRDGAESKQAKRLRLDAWANALTGLNTDRDKTASMLPYADVILTPQMLEVMYHCSDISARIVSALPDECFKRTPKVVARSAMRKAGTIPRPLDPAAVGATPVMARDKLRTEAIRKTQEQSTPEEATNAAELEAALLEMGAHEKQHEAMTWGRLYGLGAILIGANDGNPPWMPLEWDRVTSIDYLTVLDKRDLIPWRWYADYMAPKFGDVALYQLQPVGVYVGLPYEIGGSGNPVTLVHESRLIRFGGELTSKRERLRNQGADYSVLQKCFRALQLVDNNWQSASVLLADASQAVIKIKGLIDMISQEPDVMQARMQLVDMMRSVTRALILDADGEEFERKGTPFSGIPELLDQTWKRLAAAARMPLVVLVGSSAGSLNATGENEIRWWYDTISCAQEQKARPQYDRMLRMVALTKGIKNPEEYTILFPPLWNMSESEIAKMHLDQANADGVYLDRGVVTPAEVALSRFGGDKFSLETKIDVDSRKRMMELEIEQAEEQAAQDLDRAQNPPATPGVIAAAGAVPEDATPGTPDPKAPTTTINDSLDSLRIDADNVPMSERKDAGFNEEDHPRDKDGKFSENGGGGAAGGEHAAGSVTHQVLHGAPDEEKIRAQAHGVGASRASVEAAAGRNSDLVHFPGQSVPGAQPGAKAEALPHAAAVQGQAFEQVRAATASATTSAQAIAATQRLPVQTLHNALAHAQRIGDTRAAGVISRHLAYHPNSPTNPRNKRG